MKVHVVVTDESGNTFEGDLNLTRGANTSAKPLAVKKTQGEPKKALRPVMDLTPPMRAFMSKHGAGLGRPQRFTLIVARLADGKIGQPVKFTDIVAAWNRMKELLDGPFYPSCTTRARNNGWVDAPKRGIYVLLSGWEEALGKGE